MITVPDPSALLASLRADGHAGLPNVDVRIGASVLDSAIADSVERFVGREPIILSDGGPYRTPAGAVVDHLTGHLGCRVIQLGTGTVRADEETVEHSVAEVGEHRLLVSVGSGTLTDIAKITALRTGSHHVAVQTACSINGFIADRSVLVIAGAKRTVQSRWPDVLVADTDILGCRAVAVEPRWGGRSFDGAERGGRVAARRPARSWTGVQRCRRRRCPCRESRPACTRSRRA